MAEKYVLFNFDGVIADSWWLAYEAACTVHPHLTEEEHRAAFDGNIYESLQQYACDEKCRPGSDAYWAVYSPRIPELRPVAGAREFVAALAQRHALAVVSSSISMDVMTMIERFGIASHFEDVFGADVHTSKVEKIKIILDRYETSAGQCVFVTDTLGDMREAAQAGVGAIGVSWGFQHRQNLERGNPFRIVDTPEELPGAVDGYFAAPHAYARA